MITFHSLCTATENPLSVNGRAVPSRQVSRLGKDLNRVPTSSIRIGENDGEYMYAKKFKDHSESACLQSSHVYPSRTVS